MVSQSQIFSPGNMLMSNPVQIEQIIGGNICVYTYAHMYIIIINENRDCEFEESKEEYLGGFGRRTGKKETL